MAGQEPTIKRGRPPKSTKPAGGKDLAKTSIKSDSSTEHTNDEPDKEEIGEATSAIELQDMIKRRYPSLRSKVVVKAAYDALKQVNDIVDIEVRRAHKSVPKSHTAQKSALLSLPTELRCYIWEFCVLHYDDKPDVANVLRRVIHIHSSKITNKLAPRSKAALQPPITRVSREVRREALRIFYGKNEFSVTISRDSSSRESCPSSKWLHTVGPDNSKHLRNVLWLFPNENRYRAMHVESARKWFKGKGVPTRILDEMERQLLAKM